MFCKTGVLTNFTKFIRKHQRQSLVFNEAAYLQGLTLSKKGIPTQMFSCQFCEISHNTIFKEPKKLSISAKERHRRFIYLFIYLFTLYFKLTYRVKNITVKIK